MIFEPLFMILGLAVVIAAAVVIVRSLGGERPRRTICRRPHRARYTERALCAGEIDKDQSEERSCVLGE